MSQAFRLSREAPRVLGVGGELTFATAAAALPAIVQALAAEPCDRLDLAGVERSDSAGLACVLAVQADMAQRGRPLQVSNVPAGMRALALVCEVDGLMA
ncbi:sulfate transporter [Frateuria sp. Soil773]|uniref:STAS domain-containing protein n=1 Tax=Frateuria sp. Soil773 TaxID=1736407 RepID=UPI00070195FB|nr:STAS domain-containing protein [Frateuria sp. Soil773]KRE89853.1 sulfate transporter [Frateuria sp. Soil773]